MYLSRSGLSIDSNENYCTNTWNEDYVVPMNYPRASQRLNGAPSRHDPQMSFELHGLEGLRHRLKRFLKFQRSKFDPEQTLEIDTMIAGGDVKHRRVSELPADSISPSIAELPGDDVPRYPTYFELPASAFHYAAELPCPSTTGSSVVEDGAVIDLDVLVPVSLDGDNMIISDEMVAISPISYFLEHQSAMSVYSDPASSPTNSATGCFVSNKVASPLQPNMKEEEGVIADDDIFSDAAYRTARPALQNDNAVSFSYSFKEAVLNLSGSDLDTWLTAFTSEIDNVVRGKMLTYSFKEAVSELRGADRDIWLQDFISNIDRVIQGKLQHPEQQLIDPQPSIADYFTTTRLQIASDNCITPGLSPPSRSSFPYNQLGRSHGETGTTLDPDTSPALSPLADIVKAATQAVQRSLSSTCSTDCSGRPGDAEVDQSPQRSVSAPFGYVKIRTQIVTSKRVLSALNGVSQYYSAKTTRVILDPDGQGLIQLTNSQKIRRCSSYNSHTATTGRDPVRSSDLRCLNRTQSLHELFNEAPFSELLRSSSLENTNFRQSVNMVHNTRLSLRKGAKRRHRFRHGRTCSSGRGSLMRRAYPEMQCEKCGRIFEGNDRRLKLARHRRKMHAKPQSPNQVTHHETVHLSDTGLGAVPTSH